MSDEEPGCSGSPDNPYGVHFRDCEVMLRRICWKAGIAREDIEDAAMTLYIEFMERDWYDPNMLHDVGEHPDLPGPRYRPASLKTLLRNFASKRVLNIRDKQEVRHRRVPWRLDAPLSKVEGETETTWADSECYAEDSLDKVEISLVINDAVDKTRQLLVTRCSTSKRDYATFCDLVVEHVERFGCVDRKMLRAQLGISASTLSQMFREWRTRLVEAGVREAM